MAKIFAISRFSGLWSVFSGEIGSDCSVSRPARADLACSGCEPRARARGEAPRWLKELGGEYQLQFTRLVFTPLEFQELVVCYKFQF
jgi:hypothetical protein